MAEEKRSPWNSLEIAKLCCGLATPLIIAVIGFVITHQIEEQKRLQETVSAGRNKIYEDVKHGLFHIFSYIEDIHTWKEDDPDKISGYRHCVNEAMWAEPNYWRPNTFQAFKDYMDVAFQTFAGPATDALIKANSNQKHLLPNWKPEWEKRLTGSVDPTHRAKYEKFQDLMYRYLVE
jgi:hypothetical protein